jgi:SAM-dependent methyltransferase
VRRDHLGELIATDDRYWWHVAKRELVVELLRRHVPPPGRLVEAGVGAAGNLAAFRSLGYDVAGLDILPESVDRGRAMGMADLQVHDVEAPWPMPRGSVDAVVMLDVLEHLRDPSAALRHAAAVLAPRGRMVVTVPAGPWLTSTWDTLLGHHRRYTPAMLEAHAAGGGVRVVWLSHWNAFSLPAAAVLRLSERWFVRRRSTAVPRVPGLVSAALLRCARAERAVMRRTPIPCGLSLVALLSR